MSEQEEQGGLPWIKIALVALPVCLFFSAGGAVWYHWHSDTQEVADPALALGGEAMDRAEVADSLVKLGWLSGDGWESEEGKRGMRQRLSFIEGTLSPQNYGFVVQKGAEVSYEGGLWPALWVDVEGGAKREEVIVVAVQMDGRDDDVVALMTAARAMKDAKVARTIRLVWYFEGPALIGDRRGSEITDGEEVVAVFHLRGLPGADSVGGKTIGIMGPDLGGAVESRFPDGLVRSRMPLAAGDRESKALKTLGLHEASTYQLVSGLPVEEEGPGAVSRDDPAAIVEAVGDLVKMLLALAEEE
jgi:hypothetical protein